MLADLALIDKALLVGMNKLNRVLNRKNMVRPLIVSQVDHRRERRRLAAAPRPCDQYEPFAQRAELLHRIRNPQLVRRQNLRWNLAKHAADALVVAKNIAAVTSETLQRLGEVSVTAFVEFIFVRLRHDLIENAPSPLIIDLRIILERKHDAVLAKHGFAARAIVQIRRAMLDHERKVTLNIGHESFYLLDTN